MNVILRTNEPDEAEDAIDQLANWHDEHPDGVEEPDVDDTIG